MMVSEGVVEKYTIFNFIKTIGDVPRLLFLGQPSDNPKISEGVSTESVPSWVGIFMAVF